MAKSPVPLKLLSKMKANPKVIACYLFGSYLKGKKSARDIDVCIISEGMGMDEMARLAQGFSAPYDVSFMERMQDNVAFNVLREGKPIFIKSKSRLAAVWLAVVQKRLEYGGMQSRIFTGVSKWMTSKPAPTA
ncbi:MAG: nucleotidyltransferase domain-containing protein [Candidatus Micrarchaeia archaeon]